MTTIRLFPRALLSLSGVALAAVVLSACATTGETQPARYGAPPARAEAAAAAAPLPDLSAGLRCMDELLLDHGARDLTVVAEDLADPARTAGATKDLLIAAVSDMSRRSRAIRIVAQGADAGASLAARPQYVLRGSVTRHGDRTLGIGLTLMTTQDGSAVPGVASRRELRNAPGDQALRPLVEAGTIEIFGRLAKVPYWTCLGLNNDDPAVTAEIRDWYDAMAARPKEIIEYFQAQLRLRGAYAGPIDGSPSVAFNDAVARYREALGMSREPRLTQDFLRTYLAANHRDAKAKLAPAAVAAAPAPQPVGAAAPAPHANVAAPPATTAAPVAVAPAAPTVAPAAVGAASATAVPTAAAPVTATPIPLAVQLSTPNDARQFDRNEAIRLTVRATRDAHVYCFLQDENRQISRFFPNRFQRDSRIEANVGLQLPGAMRFEIRMNPKGRHEKIDCYATERDVLPELPPTLAASDFAPLPAASLEQLREAFSRAAGPAMASASLELRPR